MVADDADTVVVVVVVADDTCIIAGSTARHIPRSGEIHLRNHFDLLIRLDLIYSV